MYLINLILQFLINLNLNTRGKAVSQLAVKKQNYAPGTIYKNCLTLIVTAKKKKEKIF